MYWICKIQPQSCYFIFGMFKDFNKPSVLRAVLNKEVEVPGVIKFNTKAVLFARDLVDGIKVFDLLCLVKNLKPSASLDPGTLPEPASYVQSQCLLLSQSYCRLIPEFCQLA